MRSLAARASRKTGGGLGATHECPADCSTSGGLSLEWVERLRLMLQQQQGMESGPDAELPLSGVLLQPPCVVAQQIDVSLDDACDIYRHVSTSFLRRTNGLLTPVAVSDILSDRHRYVLPTGQQCLDGALKGGVSCGLITEITGAAGSGKTAFALHLALHTASQARGDSERTQTLWVTSDASAFPASAAAAVLNWHLGARGGDDDEIGTALRDVAVAVCPTLAHLREFLPLLRRHLASQADVRLVVLDNFSTLVRRSFSGVDDEVAERHEAVAGLMSLLKDIAQKFHAAVVVTTVSGVEIGHSFVHAVNTRLRLRRCLLGRRTTGKNHEVNGVHATHVLELVKSSVAATLRFECVFDGMCLRRVQPLDGDAVVLREDAALYGVDPFGYVILPTFVHS